MSGASHGREAMMPPARAREPIVACGVWLAGVAGFAAFSSGLGVSGAPLVASCAVFGLLFVPYPAMSVESWALELRGWLVRGGARGRARAGILWILALGIWFGTAAARPGDGLELDRAGRFVLYGLVAIGLLGGERPLERYPVRSAAAILVLWAPVEAGWVSGLKLPFGGGPGALDATRLLALDLALVLFLALAPVGRVGYTYMFGRRDWARAGLALAAFAAVAIPLGFGIGFLRAGWWDRGAGAMAIAAVDIYFVTAVPEEFLFRGLIQNWIERRIPDRPWVALIVASVIFGASHLNNPPVPNVRYAALAALAGVAYGWVWIRTRKVTAAALTHAAVDLVWLLFLRGGAPQK